MIESTCPINSLPASCRRLPLCYDCPQRSVDALGRGHEDQLNVLFRRDVNTCLDYISSISSIYMSFINDLKITLRVIGSIPKELAKLTSLTFLNISGNKLDGISEEAARGLQRLRNLAINLHGNLWINPPADVVETGLGKIVNYWEAITRSGAIVSWKLKVVLVGAVKAGKTSLVNGMLRGEPQLCHEDDRTKGVDVHAGSPCTPDAERMLELIFWDFAGHREYYPTHQVFLSKGALHLLVVDITRFVDEPAARGELVDVWLNALQCRVPGSSVLVVATHTDQFSGDLKAALDYLQRTAETHPTIKREEADGSSLNRSASLKEHRGLIFHGVHAVSSKHSESLLELRLKLSTLVYSNRDMFPSVGRRLPVSWARVSAMLDAKQSGKNPVNEGNQEIRETRPTGTKFLHRENALDEWLQVVRTLHLEKEVELTEREGKNIVFEDALGQLVQQGTILDSGGVLYLEPTWINELLKAILDHDLADVTKDQFWKDELTKFSDGNTGTFYNLKKIHNNFSSTGILTVRYLRFLWRNVTEISDKAFFDSLLSTMFRFGVMFRGNPSGSSNEIPENDMDDDAGLFVPLHLPSNILEDDLEELLKHQFRMELVFEVQQPYVPPGILGLLMSRFLHCGGVKFLKCWSRGTAFTLGEVFVVLHLDTPLPGMDESRITVNLFGDRFVTPFSTTIDMVEDEIKSMFVEHFKGVMFGLKQGYPKKYPGFNAFDGMNALVRRIDGLEAHLDRERSRLLRGLQQLKGELQVVAEGSYKMLARLDNLQSANVPCPRLVIVRPAAAMAPAGKDRSLWSMVKGLNRRVTKLVRKDMRLCFICPYDFSEVPCGFDGNGYSFPATRNWVAKIRPVLKVTAVLAKIAIKTASGFDLPVSEFLVGAKSYLGDELADRIPDDDAIDKALDGTSVPAEQDKAKTLVGKAYEELKTFIEGHECKDKEGYVHFDEVMQRVNSDGGTVWVSNKNVSAWLAARA